MEVDYQPQWDVEQFHVAEQLSLIDGVYRFDSFDLDEQAPIDHKVKSKRFFPLELLVLNDDAILTLDEMTPQFEFHFQTPLVNRFQQTGPFVFVHFDCCTFDVTRYI